MRLLIVCQAVDQNHPNLGFFVRWLREFASHTDSLVVIANEVGAYDLPNNVTVYSLGKEKGVSRLGRYLRFYSLILRERYDAVFCHMNPEFVIAGGPLWRAWGKKVILWYVHGSVTTRLKLALHLVTIACTVNAESLRIRSPKVRVVGHGIDTEYFAMGYRLNHDEMLLVTAGRLSPSKHVETIIDVIKMLQDSGVKVRASLIGGPGTSGDAEYVKKLEDKIRFMDDIRLVGAQPPSFVRDSVMGADIFLNASTTNSVDKAVLEAMAGGAIPVTSNVAFKTLLEPYGLFVHDQSAASMAKTVQTVLARTDKAELRAALRAVIVKDHNIRSLVQKIIALYE